MPVLASTTQIQNINQFGLEGLDTFDNPSDIDDVELADVRNIVYDDGVMQNRKGSLLYLSKPAGELNMGSQILVATTSDGIDYMIAVYGNNFYLADTINNQWIKLNQAYTPPTSGLFYGSANWNRGIGDDRFYFGNGTDDTMKWVMAVSLLTVAAASGDSILYLKDTSRFPGNPVSPFATETATTISFVAATKQILDSGNGFLAAGFRDGMSIKVTGSASNNGIYTIYDVALDGSSITVKENTLTDEAAGASDTITQIGVALVQGVGNIYTASTISFTSPNTISDSANGFVIAGFKIGQIITIEGSNLNNSIYTIASVSAGTITTVEGTIQNEVAGASITINNTGAFPLYYDSLNLEYTASTIAFSGSNTITDSANGFISAGFKVGQVIIVTGTELNNKTFVILTVSAGVITVVETVTNPQPIVTELAGAPITITTPTLNLDSTVGQDVAVGSTVTTPIIDMGAMPKGKILTVSQGNLFLMNYVGSENTVNYSRLGDPENFAITLGDADTAGFYTIYHGKGGIIDAKDFGEYLIIEKQDVILQWIFSISSGGDQTVNVNPVISGDGIGPTSNSTSLNYMNTLYYPTSAQGLVSFAPQVTGAQTTSALNILSQKINNLIVGGFDWSFARTCGLAQKLYWAVALPTVGVPAAVNNLVIMFDLVRASENQTQSAWTLFDNWNAVDIKPVNNVLYYMSVNDGAIYQCYASGYQDAQANNPIPYTSFALSKRFNFGQPAQLTRIQYLYLEGFLSLNTTFYVGILFNENGSLGSQTYVINGTNSIITGGAFTAGLGRFILASPVLGGVDLLTLQQLQNPLFFRCYLETTQAFRPHNVQFQVYSVAIGSQWGITKASWFTQPEASIETPLVLSPGAAPMIQL